MRILSLALAVILLLAPVCWASVIGFTYVLTSGTYQTGTTAEGTPQMIQRGDSNHAICTFIISNSSGTTPTITAKIEHSPDNTVGSYKTLCEMTPQTTGSFRENVHVNNFNTSLFPYIRSSVSTGGTSPVYTAAVKFYTD